MEDDKEGTRGGGCRQSAEEGRFFVGDERGTGVVGVAVVTVYEEGGS